MRTFYPIIFNVFGCRVSWSIAQMTRGGTDYSFLVHTATKRKVFPSIVNMLLESESLDTGSQSAVE